MEPNHKHLYFQIFKMNLLAFVVAIARHQMFLVFLWFHMEFYGKYIQKISLSEWSTKLLAEFYSGLFHGPLAEWVIELNFESLYRSLRVQISKTLESATAHSLWLGFSFFGLFPLACHGMSFVISRRLFWVFHRVHFSPLKDGCFQNHKSCSSFSSGWYFVVENFIVRGWYPSLSSDKRIGKIIVICWYLLFIYI